MIRRLVLGAALAATCACASSNSPRNQNPDYGKQAGDEAERVRDRTNTRAPASANDNAPANQGIDTVRSRSNTNAQDPKN